MPTASRCRTAPPNPTLPGLRGRERDALTETAGAMKVAGGFEPAAVIGPLIDMKPFEKVEARIADAVDAAATVKPRL